MSTQALFIAATDPHQVNLAANGIMTVLGNLTHSAQVIGASVISLAGVCFIVYIAIKSKFSIIQMITALLGVFVAAMVVYQVVGWMNLAKSDGSSITGVRGSYGMPQTTSPGRITWSA